MTWSPRQASYFLLIRCALLLGPPRLRGQLTSTRKAVACQGLGERTTTQECTTLSRYFSSHSDRGQRPLPALCPLHVLAAGRAHEHCFLTNCWASLTCLFKGSQGLVLGRLGEERNFLHPTLHRLTPNRGSRTRVSTGISSFRNPWADGRAQGS